jgi:endonuclease/exonuclease/phosphatase family metal-dependent hydrolase
LAIAARSSGGTGFSLALVGLAASVLSVLAGATLYAVATNPPPNEPLDNAALRAMSFNIRVNTTSDGANDWPHRRDLAAAAIRFHQADLVGIQEAYRDMIDDVQYRLPGYRWVGAGTTDGHDAGAMNPVMWRESRLELLRWETIWLSPTPRTPSVGWDAAYPRTVTYAILRERRSGAELHVFNTHLDHEGEQAREQSALLIAERVNALPTEARVVLLGDFNCNNDAAPLCAIGRHTTLRNAREVSLTGHYGPTGSFTGFAGPQYTGPLIDHIFVRGLVVQQHGILPDHHDGRLPSDHFPVLAEILIE